MFVHSDLFPERSFHPDLKNRSIESTSCKTLLVVLVILSVSTAAVGMVGLLQKIEVLTTTASLGMTIGGGVSAVILFAVSSCGLLKEKKSLPSVPQTLPPSRTSLPTQIPIPPPPSRSAASVPASSIPFHRPLYTPAPTPAPAGLSAMPMPTFGVMQTPAPPPPLYPSRFFLPPAPNAPASAPTSLSTIPSLFSFSSNDFILEIDMLLTVARDGCDIQQFHASDLLPFAKAIQNYSFDYPLRLPAIGYYAWYDPSKNEINIQKCEDKDRLPHQPTNHLSIQVDEKKGRVISIFIDGKMQLGIKKIPEKFLAAMNVAFRESLRVSSRYDIQDSEPPDSPFMMIKIVRRGLKEIPDYHLKELYGLLLQTSLMLDPKIKVDFLTNILGYGIGVDAGGLSRDYLDELFAGLLSLQILRFAKIKSTSLFVPMAKEPFKNGTFPKLGKEEETILRQMGRVMMYCYHSKGAEGGDWNKVYTIGRHFNDDLFKAALCLTGEEIDRSFDALNETVKLKMCKVLCEAYEDKSLNIMILLLERSEWTPGDFEKCVGYIHYGAGILPQDLKLGDQADDEPDMEKISKNFERMHSLLKEFVYSKQWDFIEGEIGGQLPAIHALAKGLKEGMRNDVWNRQFSGINALAFSQKVQGSINRKNITQQIVVDPALTPDEHREINKKVGWLKKWIEDVRTPIEDIRKFLKFATASSSLNGKITVKKQVGIGRDRVMTPVPVSHSCFSQIELAPVPCGTPDCNDRSEESFIKCLKEMVLRDAGAYSSA